MPHLLVAGATGQGKSVGLNAIITSLLYKKHPSQLKFVMVDPKKVELSIYSIIEKHFLAKLPDEEEAIITETAKVVNTLNSLCIEMDSRYDLLKMAQVRNIKEYNEKFIKRQLNPNNGHKYLPYIVVVVDEFADLIMTAGKEVEYFLNKGHVNFSDEVELATAVTRVCNASKPTNEGIELYGVDVPRIRRIIDEITEEGYLSHHYVQQLLAAAGIQIVREEVSSNKKVLLRRAEEIGYPVVAKVVGPIHKSDIGGVAVNIQSKKHLAFEFERMMKLPDVSAVMIQPMLQGKELFVGAKYEPRFGHIILCGLGGIFVEVLRDIASGLAPLSHNEAFSMIRSLRAYKMFRGVRGEAPIDEVQFAEIIVRLSTLLRFATEIKEMDINPLLATSQGIIAVDARIRVEK